MTEAKEPPRQAGKSDLRRTAQWLGICLVGVTVLALIATQVPERGRLIGLFSVVFGMLSGWGMGYVATECSLRRSLFAFASAGTMIATALVGVTYQQYREYCAELEKIYKAPPEIEYQRSGQPATGTSAFWWPLQKAPSPPEYALNRRDAPSGERAIRFTAEAIGVGEGGVGTRTLSCRKDSPCALTPEFDHTENVAFRGGEGACSVTNERMRPTVTPGMFAVPSKSRSAEKTPAKSLSAAPTRPKLPSTKSIVAELQATRLKQLEEKSRFPSYLQHRLKQVAELSATWAIVIWIGELLLGAAAGVWMFYRVVPGPGT